MYTKYDKILADSNTNGVKGIFQLIIPYLTSYINYNQYKVKYEPSCTLEIYPTKYEYYMELSRSFFKDDFILKINELITFFDTNKNIPKKIE